jgi:hypothetical protein
VSTATPGHKSGNGHGGNSHGGNGHGGNGHGTNRVATALVESDAPHFTQF